MFHISISYSVRVELKNGRCNRIYNESLHSFAIAAAIHKNHYSSLFTVSITASPSFAAFTSASSREEPFTPR